MAWVRFTADFDFPKGEAWHVAYKAGMRCNVTMPCAAAARAAGAAKPITSPSREVAARLADDPYWTVEG